MAKKKTTDIKSDEFFRDNPLPIRTASLNSKLRLSLVLIWLAALILIGILNLQQNSILSAAEEESKAGKNSTIENLTANDIYRPDRPEYNNTSSIVFINKDKKYFMTRYAYFDQPVSTAPSITGVTEKTSVKTKKSGISGTSVVIHKIKGSGKPKKDNFVIKPLFQ